MKPSLDEIQVYCLFYNVLLCLDCSIYKAFLNKAIEVILAARELPLSVSLIQSEDLIATAKNIIELIDEELNIYFTTLTTTWEAVIFINAFFACYQKWLY